MKNGFLSKSPSPKFNKEWKKIITSIFYVCFTGVMLLGCSDASTINSITTEAQAETEIVQQEELNKIEEKNEEEKKATEEKAEDSAKQESEKEEAEEAEKNNTIQGNLEVHFIDVGQADSILVKHGDFSMLVDAGNNEDGDLVNNYIKSKGISKLDYVVGTHPHEDHIGGLDDVINNFDIGAIYIPKASTTTKTFESVLLAIQNKGMKVKSPIIGDKFDLGGVTVTILGPNSNSYDDLNDSSIVLKVDYGTTSFLLTGDAEGKSESEILASGININSTVLKVGHHGSDSSTTDEFLNKVNPKFAVISVGEGNSYGHPKQSVLNKLQSRNIPVYRTDENGTIVAISDGNNVTFNTNQGSYIGGADTEGESTSNSSNSSGYVGSSNTTESQSNSGQSSNSTSGSGTTTAPDPSHDVGRTVFYTPNGKSYHFNKNCSTLSRSKVINSGTLDQVIALGKSDPCNICAQ